MQHNLFLIGPMGAGKTTIGRQLATRLQLPFIDSDHEIVSRAGADIPWIFDVEGEQGFRDRESRIIDELTQQQGIVLATGGGAVLREQNRQYLRDRGLVVYLKTSVERQLERTAKDKNRPLLQTDNPRKTLEKLAADRNPIYEQAAHLVVSTDSNQIKSVVNTVVKRLHENS